MATLILAILYIWSLPALLPRWQHVFLVGGAFLAVSVVTFGYLLSDLGAPPSGGDGPAFATLVILFGCTQVVVAASLVGRLIAQSIARSLAPPTKTRVVKLLLAVSLALFALASALVALYYAGVGLIGLAALLLFPFFWLALALQFAPNNSFKR